MAWEDSVELHNAVGGALLQPAEEGAVEAAFALDAGVCACCIDLKDGMLMFAHGGNGATSTHMPYVNKQVVDWLAVVHIDELHLQVHWNSCLFLNDIAAYHLSQYIIRTDGNF